MKDNYDFSKGKRGRILPPEAEPAGKVRITIRLDEDVINYFLERAGELEGRSGYQTLINNALRAHIDGKAPKIADTLRAVIREELRRPA